MVGQIEKMNRMRNNILSNILIGTVIAFCLNIYPTFYTIIHPFRRFTWTWKNHLFYGAVYLWFLTLLIFIIRYWLYKKKLKKDLTLPSAVNDERVKQIRLKAYRFAFFVAVGLTIIWKSREIFFSNWLMNPRFSLPNGPFLVLWGAIMSFVGSFLYFNRRAEND